MTMADMAQTSTKDEDTVAGAKRYPLDAAPTTRCQRGSVIGMSSQRSWRKVPMKNEKKAITKTAAGNA